MLCNKMPHNLIGENVQLICTEISFCFKFITAMLLMYTRHDCRISMSFRCMEISCTIATFTHPIEH